ncbi:DegV family protein [Marinithermus hydrothermalis]|uniref:DegV family protein n=1 Tax=Marinithermus hydrothermalis (strain DSM 14884 / JCM 11576 / T1) TaxID=869210 RepID=F2NQP2_MARHT|nr:degV family protein [Marinithermus hydrothermalis DSM 14884]
MTGVELGIVTDSASELSVEMAAEWGVGMVPLYITLDGQRYRDRVELSPEALVAALRRGAQPTTSPPEIEDFVEVYRRYLKHYDYLISIHLSGALSETVQRAQAAAEQVAPHRIRVIDSRAVSGGLGALVLQAAEWIREGRELEEVLQGVEEIRERSRFFFTVADLEHLVRGGRLPRVGQALGEWLGLRPMLTMEKGRLKLLRPVRDGNQPQALAQAVARSFPGRALRVTITVADTSREPVEAIKQALTASGARIEKGRVTRMGGVAGSHTGPGALAVHAYPVS